MKFKVRFKDAASVESELLRALSKSLKPTFQLLEDELKKGDGKRLCIAISVKGGEVKMEYSVGSI